MPLNRFRNENGNQVDISNDIYRLVQAEEISVKYILTEGNKRLDHYAHEYYGDGMNWWIIAAASGIGWWLQCPEGTIIAIPTNLSQIERLL